MKGIKKDRLSAIDSYRKAVDNLITVLNTPVMLGERESDLKAKLKSKKNAFVSAKEIMIVIYDMERTYFTKINYQWFESRVESLCEAAQNAIGEMCQMIEREIDSAELGGSEINAAIDMRGDGAKDISQLFDGIEALNESLKKAANNEDMFEEEDNTYISIAEEYSEV